MTRKKNIQSGKINNHIKSIKAQKNVMVKANVLIFPEAYSHVILIQD